MVKIELSESDQLEGNRIGVLIFFVTRKVSKFFVEGGIQNSSVLGALFTLKHLAPKQIFYDNSHSRVCLSLTNVPSVQNLFELDLRKNLLPVDFVVDARKKKKFDGQRGIFQSPAGFSSISTKIQLFVVKTTVRLMFPGDGLRSK